MGNGVDNPADVEVESLTMSRQRSPRVSVLMPAFNAEPFLKDAIRSVLHQTFEDFEFIIVDDGSTDSTPQTLAEFARRDPRIRLSRNESNQGIVRALNKGLAMCQGEYVARMDADDVSTPDRLEKQVLHMDHNPQIVVLGAAVRYMDADGQPMDIVRYSAADHSLLYENPLLHPTVVIRKETLDRTGARYEDRYIYAEDYYLWLRLSKEGSLSSIPDVVVDYRISSSATRVCRLKGVIWATLKVKWDGVFKLRMRPTFVDVARFLAEGILMILPAAWVLKLYMALTFRKEGKVAI